MCANVPASFQERPPEDALCHGANAQWLIYMPYPQCLSQLAGVLLYDAASGFLSIQQKISVNERTDITPNRRDNVRVVSPNDAIHADAESLHDMPKRKKADANVPRPQSLPREGQKHKDRCE